MKPHEWILITFLLLFSLSQTGCAGFNRGLKSLLGGDTTPPPAEKPVSKETKFSESGDLPPRVKRQYKRTTKESLAEESALDSKAGSLWVMEGQGAYLFSQNVVRLVGDPLAVNLEGDPKDQLQSKVSVIKKLLSKIDERQRLRMRAPSAEGGVEAKPAADDGAGGDAKTAAAGKKGAAADQASTAKDDASSDIGVKTVPTRIVERTLDGNYRVKGAQPFMIGSREYKIIVTGVVRAEDFNDEGIASSKLLDPKFDIVSARKTEAM